MYVVACEWFLCLSSSSAGNLPEIMWLELYASHVCYVHSHFHAWNSCIVTIEQNTTYRSLFEQCQHFVNSSSLLWFDTYTAVLYGLTSSATAVNKVGHVIHCLLCMCVRSVLSVGDMHCYMDKWLCAQWNPSVSSVPSTGCTRRFSLVHR